MKRIISVRRSYIAALLLLTSFLPALLGDEPSARLPLSATNKPPAPTPSQSKIIVSKETTYVLGPLREDGSVDFLAALNEHLRKGITPENNAAIAFWKAIGPTKIPATAREAFFKALGIPVLPEDGAYFLSTSDFYKRHIDAEQLTTDQETQYDRDLSDPFDEAVSRPWSTKEFPILAKWLEKNAAVLDNFVADSRRPRFYSPLYYNGPIDNPNSIFNVGGVIDTREIERALCARATLQLKAARVNEAWRECLAGHRLGRLVGQGPYLVDVLVGKALDGIACSADQVIAEHGKLSVGQARQFQDDLDDLPSLPKTASAVTPGDRLFGLNLICCLEKQDPKTRRESARSLISFGGIIAGGEKVRQQAEAAAALVSDDAVEWNEVLRITNHRFDRITAAYRQPRHERKATLSEMRGSVEKAPPQSRGSKHEAREEASRKVVNALLFEGSLVSNWTCFLDERWATHVQLTKLSFALAAYQTENGKYPARLADLAPQYIAEVPHDLFTGGELHYKPAEKGYLLYSVGPNEKDDDGRDINSEPEGDDIAIRVPRQPPDSAAQKP